MKTKINLEDIKSIGLFEFHNELFVNIVRRQYGSDPLNISMQLLHLFLEDEVIEEIKRKLQ